MFLIVALVIVAIMLLVGLVTVGIYAAIGLKRGIVSIIATAASAILAGIATLAICSPELPVISTVIDCVVETAMGVIPAGMLPTEIMDLIVSVVNLESIGSAAVYYASMIIGPFVFVLLFVLFAFLSSLIGSLIVSFIPIMKKIPKAANHLGGATIGVVAGVLAAILFISPIAGLAGIVEDNYDYIADIEAVKSFEESLSVEYDGKVMGAFDYIGSGLIFGLFSTTTVNGEMTTLKSESGVIVNIVIDVISIINSTVDFGEQQVDAINGIIDSVDGSPIIKSIIVDVVGFAIDNELLSFDMGEMINPLIDATIEVIGTSTEETITEDLKTLVNVLGIVIDSGILEATEPQAVLNKIGDGLASELLVEINKNERMAPVADEITNLSIRAFASTLGIPANAEERYNNLMNRIAAEFNATSSLNDTERAELLNNNLGKVFGDYGIEVTGEALDHLVEGLMSDFDGDVNGTAVKEFFMLYHSGDVAGDSSAAAGDGVEYLSTESDSKVVVNSDGTISIGGVVFEYYNANNYKSSKAITFGRQHVSIGAANTLYSASTTKSTILTAEDIIAGMGHYGSCEDAIAESEKVGEIFKMFTGIVADKDLENLDGMALFEELGPIFDKMQRSEIFKTESAQNMLTAILQSDTVSGVLGLSVKDMTNFADKINDFASDKDTGYEEATKVISGTVNAVSKAADKEATEEEKVEATKNMIDNVSKDSAEMVGSMLTDTMIDKFGTETGNTENAASAVKNLINNMADYKETSPDNDSVAKEAEAVTKLITVATTANSDDPLFDTEDGQKGVVASDPESLINTVVQSDVVMKTITQSVEQNGSNPYGVVYSSEKEKESVANALESYFESNGGGEDLAGKLTSIAIIMNVEINLNKGGNDEGNVDGGDNGDVDVDGDGNGDINVDDIPDIGDLPDIDIGDLPDIDIDDLPDIDMDDLTDLFPGLGGDSDAEDGSEVETDVETEGDTDVDTDISMDDILDMFPDLDMDDLTDLFPGLDFGGDSDVEDGSEVETEIGSDVETEIVSGADTEVESSVETEADTDTGIDMDDILDMFPDIDVDDIPEIDSDMIPDIDLDDIPEIDSDMIPDLDLGE